MGPAPLSRYEPTTLQTAVELAFRWDEKADPPRSTLL